MKKCLQFLLMIMTVIGIIGGVGYTVYCEAYLISAGLLVTAYMVWPRLKEIADELAD